jgi:hypothetical protein
MPRSLTTLICGFVIASGCAIAQPPTAFLDILKVHVRPEKRKDYEDAIKRLAEVNRKFKGDRWIAISTEYGDSGSLIFASLRDNMASIETAYGAFEKAMKEGFGSGAEQFMYNLGAWSASYTTEIRRRRLDLSVNPPSSPEDVSKMVASSRWLRTYRADLKPGKSADYVAAWRPFQAELAKVTPPITVLVSESVTGTPALFFATYLKSLADIDVQSAAVQKAIASVAYVNLQKSGGDAQQSGMWEIHRIRPDLSCAPEEIVNLDPAFWKPAPRAPAKPKPEAPAQKK